MIRCNEVRQHLQDYIDNEVPYSIRQEIDEHLLGCLSCHAELESYRRLSAILQLRSVPDPGKTYWQLTWKRIQRRLPATPVVLAAGRKAPKPTSGLWEYLKPALSLVAMLALLLAGFLGMQQYKLSARPQLVADQSVEYELYYDDRADQEVLVRQAVSTDLRPDITFAAFSRAAIGGFDPVSKGVGMVLVEAEKK